MEPWQEKYDKQLKEMSNQEVLDEYTMLASGDDYDGCWTKHGEWCWRQVSSELESRLKSIGFLE